MLVSDAFSHAKRTPKTASDVTESQIMARLPRGKPRITVAPIWRFSFLAFRPELNFRKSSVD